MNNLCFIFTTPSRPAATKKKAKKRGKRDGLQRVLHLHSCNNFLLLLLRSASASRRCSLNFRQKGRPGLSTAAGWPCPQCSQLYAEVNFTRLKQAGAARLMYSTYRYLSLSLPLSYTLPTPLPHNNGKVITKMAAFELFKAFPLFISCFTAETVFLFAFLMRYCNEGGRGRGSDLNICNAVKLKNSRGHVVVEARGGGKAGKTISTTCREQRSVL